MGLTIAHKTERLTLILRGFEGENAAEPKLHLLKALCFLKFSGVAASLREAGARRVRAIHTP